MRLTHAAFFVTSAVTWASLALAQEPSTPPLTSTTTTAQAAVDTTMAMPPPPPPARESWGAERTTYVNGPLLVAGLVLFGASYGPAIGIAAESSRPGDRPNLYIPVAGPWIDLGQRGCTPQLPCSDEGGTKALLVADGVTQGLGTLAMITSLFVPEKKGRHWFILGNEMIHATPTMVGGAYGMAAAGKF